MDRRSFLVGATAAAALAKAQTAARTIPSRRVYSLNRNWLFARKDTAGADESKFRRITLPHSNVDLPWHSVDDQAYEFVSLYRRHFHAPAAWNGKRVFVDFGGAMTASKVTINGHAFPEYRGGYTPFSFELTPHLKYGGDNLLAVELDSTERGDIPPFGNAIDYLTFGGIYRDVELGELSRRRISPTCSPSRCKLHRTQRPVGPGALLCRRHHREANDHYCGTPRWRSRAEDRVGNR